MNKQQRDYEIEMARDTDPAEWTPEQRAVMERRDIGISLDTERQQVESDRRSSGAEDRMIESYRLYMGERDANGVETFEGIAANKVSVGSRAYANVTRQITNDGAAQIGDLLFPNDDRNYGVKALGIARPPMALEDQPAVDSKGKPIVDQEGNPLTNGQAHDRRVERSKKKASRMFTKIDGALIKGRYPSKARKCIADGAMFGTGVMKSPIPTADGRGRWAKKSGGAYGLRKTKELYPDTKIVRPLDFYPDMSAMHVSECRYIWERMATSPEELEKAIIKHGYDEEATRRILESGPHQKVRDGRDPTDEARAHNSPYGRAEGRHILWERHGSMKRTDLERLGVKTESKGLYLNAIITVCDAEVLKAVEVPYECDASLYSVYCWDEDPMSIFGYGIPWLMQDQQRSYVSTWRMALDNGGMSAVPQVVIDRATIEPVNGKWEFRGGKEWYKKSNKHSLEGGNRPFEVFPIEQNLQQLFVMMDRSVADAYEVTGVTRVEKSNESLDNAPVTLGATQIMQGNSSVSRRSQARRWDDEVTLGLVTRMYDYFMQFDKDEDIKAPMEIEPRGATVLLAKELTATNTIQLYQMTEAGQVPGAKGIPILRGIETAMQIPAGTYVETESEQLAREQREAEMEPEVDPMIELETRKIEIEEARVELEQMDRQLTQLKNSQKYETDMLSMQLEEALAIAHLDDNAQSRIDKFHSDTENMRNKHMGELTALQAKLATDRDQTAAKINADSGLKARKNDVDAQKVALQERELNYKMTTGNEGI